MQSLTPFLSKLKVLLDEELKQYDEDVVPCERELFKFITKDFVGFISCFDTNILDDDISPFIEEVKDGYYGHIELISITDNEMVVKMFECFGHPIAIRIYYDEKSDELKRELIAIYYYLDGDLSKLTQEYREKCVKCCDHNPYHRKSGSNFNRDVYNYIYKK